MLTDLQVNNFAILNALSIELTAGMTAITGETGAGKSIAIDALSFCLGQRMDKSAMTQDLDKKTSVSARFDISQNKAAQHWLSQHELIESSEPNQCLLRRVVSHHRSGNDTRSRSFINGTPVTQTQLKDLGGLLIHVHGQQTHQQLQHAQHQQHLLDAYAGHSILLKEVNEAHQTWLTAKRSFEQWMASLEDKQSKLEILIYKQKELNALNLQPGEFEQLEQEHQRLYHAQQLKTYVHQALFALDGSAESSADSASGQNEALGLLEQVNQAVSAICEIDPSLNGTKSLINDAIISAKEASDELKDYQECIELDPEQLAHTEQRYSQALSIARKYKWPAEQLHQYQQEIQSQINDLECSEDAIATKTQALDLLKQKLITCSARLHQSRAWHAKQLNQQITQVLHSLNMDKATFTILVDFDDSKLGANGADNVCFCISTNEGQSSQPMAKIASGGELSRIALAINLVTAQKVHTPSLVFDEADVGVSGPTAAIVGKMLRQLGQMTQVLCITHLPQVAALANQHFFVNKQRINGQTQTQITDLNQNEKLHEIARLLGGAQVTKATLANAKELMATN